ncbi:hypothetical protein PV733_36800 [Streptomyces europaeiscabiei]|uniref:hypothetical protein n=1 Tax=Streptomyces europaeiscabiei TaxID=146819 RepID=UPI0029B7AC1E|nr:hypothetical protein [Streptomyces europaeiscabiei]MDX3714391.1 hypothetical protein [Streptomyces europaeiscabiei]
MTVQDTADLATAADKLRKLANNATPGPWQRPLNTRYKHTVTGALPEGERGAWLDGIDPATGEREQCTVATVPIWSNGKHSRPRGGRDLEYIAAMHPGVGAALADWLGCLAMLDPTERGGDECGWCSANHPAAVARAINAT